MGYLDNSTVTVDAVLTTKGRQILATGGGINVQYACLVDTGIDYGLYNPDHPSGSASYAEAITTIPNVEPVPHSVFFLRNRLVSYDSEVTELPFMHFNIGASHDFGTQCGAGYGIDLIPEVLPNMGDDENSINDFIFVVSDNSVLEVLGGQTMTSYEPLIQSYIPQQDFYNYGVYSFQGQLTLTPICGNSQARTLYATVIAANLGLAQGLTLTIGKNDDVTVASTGWVPNKDMYGQE
tara:strand:- start:1059 stop:1769 length:711 start_codon:yes stop_codon:yes gene_type:complete